MFWLIFYLSGIIPTYIWAKKDMIREGYELHDSWFGIFLRTGFAIMWPLSFPIMYLTNNPPKPPKWL